MSMQHTPGPWIVRERLHPYRDGSKSHIERGICTQQIHPQLKDHFPVVCMSVGIGMTAEKPSPFVHIKEADAHLIAAAPALLAELKKARAVLKEQLDSYIETCTRPVSGLVENYEDRLSIESDQDMLDGIDRVIDQAEGRATA